MIIITASPKIHHNIFSGFRQKYSPLRLYFEYTAHLAQMQPSFVAFSSALPFAQKSPPVNLHFWYVGHFGQMHIFMLSEVSGTLPICFSLHSFQYLFKCIFKTNHKVLQLKITKLNSLKYPEFSPKRHENCDVTGRIRFIT
jgi:hypothetical protein